VKPKVHSPYVSSPKQQSVRYFGDERALILNAVLISGMTTSVESGTSGSDGRTLQERFRSWEATGQSSSLVVMDLKASGLWPDVEEDEQKLLLSDRISIRQRIDASWLGESIASLLWALQMIPDLSSYDREADLTLASRLRSDPIPELIGHAELRSFPIS
jgi:hypothetical protein